MEFDGRRRFRAAVEDLSEFSDRYKGKSVSRKKLNKSDSEDEEDDEEDGLNEIDEEEEDEEEVDEDDEIEEQDDDEDEEEEEENEDEFETKKAKSKKDDGKDGGMNLIKFDQKEEIAKGKAVKNQLSLFHYYFLFSLN